MKKLLLTLPLCLAGACASITQGSNQTLSVVTDPAGAECQLTNDEGQWYVKETPGSVTVHRSADSLSVSCESGELAGAQTFESKTKAMAFGNIVAGGLIGVAVDNASGAAFDYPQQISIKLSKREVAHADR